MEYRPLHLGFFYCDNDIVIIKNSFTLKNHMLKYLEAKCLDSSNLLFFLISKDRDKEEGESEREREKERARREREREC